LAAHNFCIVFENDIERVWPSLDRKDDKQAVAILDFAKANNLSAVIQYPRMQVTFKKLPA
jgi:hypothetical protein